MFSARQNRVRVPQVAGKFYPANKEKLSEQIADLIDPKAVKSDCIACILPHAGYVYSGLVAGQTVSQVNLKAKIILLGPNHTGLGAPFSLMSNGTWKTPLGEVKIDEDLAGKLIRQSKYLKEDSLAHENEHSLEVELPFLQYFRTDFQIIPIAFMSDDLAALKAVGKEIAAVIQDAKIKDSVLLIASTDMTHYEPQAQAEKKDHQAIEAILALDEDELARRISEMNITMCGYAPVIAMLSAAKALGAKQGKLVKYQTSGAVTQDTQSVVGYAGIIIS